MPPDHTDLLRLRQATRINVVGTSGSGKSTFGRQLAELLKLPFCEMDSLFWQPDWQETPDEELLARVRAVTGQPGWVLDGNYTRTIPVKWPRTQVVVWLDLSLPRTLYQVTRRSLCRALSQQELWAGTGNRESLRRSFLSRESVILWSLQTHRSNRAKYHDMMHSAEYKHLRFLRLQSSAEVAACLRGLRELTNAQDSGRETA